MASVSGFYRIFQTDRKHAFTGGDGADGVTQFVVFRQVIFSHIDDGKNFFEYEPEEHYDCIISNPPFSLKDDVLKRLYELETPYAILLPLPTLQGQKRFEYLKDCQALIFDKRINFYSNEARTQMAKGVAFASIYICRDFLPRDLIFEKEIFLGVF